MGGLTAGDPAHRNIAVPSYRLSGFQGLKPLLGNKSPEGLFVASYWRLG